MARRLVASTLLAMATLLAAGCASQDGRDGKPVVHHPLLYRYYSHDLVAPRAPPPFVVEPVHTRTGYVWAHSYWRWDGHDYVAVPGQWIPARTDYRYVDARWEQHRDGWHFRPGHWLFQ